MFDFQNRGYFVCSRVRPISVPPQLYRLWGKVISAQLFKHFATQILKHLTGMIQRRGPMDASYEWQFWLENHAYH